MQVTMTSALHLFTIIALASLALPHASWAQQLASQPAAKQAQAKPQSKSPAKAGNAANKPKEASAKPEKMIVRRDYHPEGGVDLYIFYDGGKEPIAAVVGKQIIITEQVKKSDTARIMDLQLAHTLGSVGLTKRAEGNYVEAEKAYKSSIEYGEKTDKNTGMLVWSLMNLAGLYLHMDKPQESEALYKRCISLMDEEPPSERAAILDNLAQALDQQNKFSEAEEYNKKALAIYRAQVPVQPLDIAKCFGTLAYIQMKQNKFSDATTSIQEALKQAESSGDQKELAILHDEYASIYFYQNNYKEAIAEHQKALPLLEKSYGTEHPETGVCLASMGNSYRQMRDWKNASDCIKRALDIFQKSQGAESAIAQRLSAEYKDCTEKAANLTK